MKPTRNHRMDQVLQKSIDWNCKQYFWDQHSVKPKTKGNQCTGNRLACVACISVWFWSKKGSWKGTFGFDCTRNEMRTKKRERRRGRRKHLQTNPLDFEKPAFASERSTCLAWLVGQYWHVSIKGLFHTERSCMVCDRHLNFLWLFFILVSKIYPARQEHFNFFWNA